MTDDSDEGGALPEIIKQAGAIATGLPPQVQRNFWKAAGRVLKGMAEWPAAYFEGRAAITRARLEAEAAELRARQRARESIMLRSADAASQQFENPELALRALEYHAADLVREHAAREAVMQHAIDDLNASPPDSDAASELEDDWLTMFLREASTKSSEDVRTIFGKILAGEIRAPGSFSVRTLQSVGFLTQQAANMLQTFFNMSIHIGDADARVVSTPFGNAGQNSLSHLGLSYGNLMRLVEYGFVRPDFSERIEFPSDLYERGISFDYSGITVWLALSKNGNKEKLPKRLRLEGPCLTQVGTELRRVVAMMPVPEYAEAQRVVRGTAADYLSCGSPRRQYATRRSAVGPRGNLPRLEIERSLIGGSETVAIQREQAPSAVVWRFSGQRAAAATMRPAGGTSPAISSRSLERIAEAKVV